MPTATPTESPEASTTTTSTTTTTTSSTTLLYHECPQKYSLLTVYNPPTLVSNPVPWSSTIKEVYKCEQNHCDILRPIHAPRLSSGWKLVGSCVAPATESPTLRLSARSSPEPSPSPMSSPSARPTSKPSISPTPPPTNFPAKSPTPPVRS